MHWHAVLLATSPIWDRDYRVRGRSADVDFWEQNMNSQDGHGYIILLGFALQRRGVCSNELPLSGGKCIIEQIVA